MMVVKVVSENLLSDQKAGVAAAQLSNGFRQRQTEFRQAELPRVFSRSLIHIDFGSFSVKFQRLPARFSTSCYFTKSDTNPLDREPTFPSICGLPHTHNVAWHLSCGQTRL